MSDDHGDAMARFIPSRATLRSSTRLSTIAGKTAGEWREPGLERVCEVVNARVEGLRGLRITELNVSVSDVVATIDG